jgi:hypothetical protein
VSVLNIDGYRNRFLNSTSASQELSMAKDVPNLIGTMNVPNDYLTTSYLLKPFRTDPRRICHYGLLRLYNALMRQIGT